MAEISKDADGEAERNGLSTDFTDGTDFFGVLGVSCWQMVPMLQIPEGLASLPRCSIRVHPCHPWLVNPVHERGWTTDLTDGHGSEARELSADDAADRQGLEVKRLRTFEGMPKPSMDWVVQPLPLRNRRHLRFSDLPVLG